MNKFASISCLFRITTINLSFVSWSAVWTRCSQWMKTKREQNMKFRIIVSLYRNFSRGFCQGIETSTASSFLFFAVSVSLWCRQNMSAIVFCFFSRFSWNRHRGRTGLYKDERNVLVIYPPWSSSCFRNSHLGISSVLLARLLNWLLLLVAICDHLVPAGSRETRHALSFPLDHSVFLEACDGAAVC